MTAVDLLFGTGSIRAPGGWVGGGAKVLAALIAVGVIYGTVYAIVDLFQLTIVFLAAMLVLVFLIIGATADADPVRIPPLDWGLALAAAVTGLYFVANSRTIITRMTLFDELTAFDILFGTALLLLVLEVSRRTTGLGLTLLVLFFFAYDLFGHRLSGPLGHGFIPYDHFLDIIVFTTDGIFGAPLRVAATYAFLFVLFGTMLVKAGGGEFFFNLAARLTGKSVGGPAKIAVISSGLYGTISGNPVSDALTTGSVTIPVMIRLGYPPTLAGAIEVAASAGGSLAPPVMGAAAFIMAEYTGIPYVEIMIAATIPAFLYYLGIYAQVHLSALRLGLKGLDPSEIPSARATIAQGWVFVIPILVLVLAIAAGLSVNLTAVVATVAVVAVAAIRPRTRIGLVALFDALSETTLRMAPVAGACAAAGLIVGGLTMTGLVAKFADVITLITGNSVFVSLLVTAVLTIVFGLGLPTSSSYILAAVLIGPVLVKLGVSLMAAHMFILYYAVLSAVTPPVAIAAYAVAAIAKSNPLTLSVLACRISIVAFVVPFAFAYHESILLTGDFVGIVGSTVLAIIGVVLLAIAVEGHLDRAVSWPARLLFGAGGLCFFGSSAPILAAAVGLSGAGSVLHRFVPRTLGEPKV
ncbi:MAG: TRAP transporter permease [Pseudomonadota bacterium]